MGVRVAERRARRLARGSAASSLDGGQQIFGQHSGHDSVGFTGMAHELSVVSSSRQRPSSFERGKPASCRTSRSVEGARGLLFFDGVLELRGGHSARRPLQHAQQSPLPNELRTSMDKSVGGHAAPVYTRTTRRETEPDMLARAVES